MQNTNLPICKGSAGEQEPFTHPCKLSRLAQNHITKDNVCGAGHHERIFAKVHPAHLMNVRKHHVVTKLQTNQNDLRHKSACMLLSSTPIAALGITIQPKIWSHLIVPQTVKVLSQPRKNVKHMSTYLSLLAYVSTHCFIFSSRELMDTEESSSASSGSKIGISGGQTAMARSSSSNARYKGTWHAMSRTEHQQQVLMYCT